MALTDNCDLYLGVHEHGVNTLLDQVRRQRPELFNYASADVAANPDYWCVDVPHTSDVTKHNNPFFTIMAPLPLLGADNPAVSVGFCAQVSEASVDFYPSNTISLPAQLNPPLAAQQFALQLKLCGGIVCPSDKQVDQIPAGTIVGDQLAAARQRPRQLTGRPDCFCLNVFATGQVGRRLINGRATLLAQIDALDIVGLAPAGLRRNLICYLKTSLNVMLREKMTIAIQTLMLDAPLFGLGTLELFPTPDPPIAANPAIDEDQVKVFVTMKIV